MRPRSMLRTVCLLLAWTCVLTRPGVAQTVSEASDLQIVRQGNRLEVRMVSLPENRTVTIPRRYASLSRVHFLDQLGQEGLTLHPEPSEWVIRWSSDVTTSDVLVLEFDTDPLVESEVQPVRQAGDGTMLFCAHQAMTIGEKLRFEPQPHKNTLGYWTMVTDVATWRFSIDRPGTFNVGILQGCGKGQGGSDGELVIQSADGILDTLPFSTVDTGHFQNFVWRNLGTVHIGQKGNYEIQLQPKRIEKGAFMDVRLMHLSPAR